MDEAGSVFISVTPAAVPTPHLGEVPALDEMSGNITRSFAVHHRGDVMPGHPRGGVSINEVYGTGKHAWTSSDTGHKCGKAQGPPPQTEVSGTRHRGLVQMNLDLSSNRQQSKSMDCNSIIA